MIKDFQSWVWNKNISKYFDKPIEAVKKYKTYDKLVDSIKNISNIEVKNMIEKWIKIHEKKLADMIIGKDEIYINCEHGSEIVHSILSDAKIPHTIKVGGIRKETHAWVELLDHTVIDPTKDQFPNISYDEYIKDIHWEKEIFFKN